MSISLLITLTCLGLAAYLTYRLLMDRPFYLLNSRNKSDIGYFGWWLQKHLLFLAGTCASYLIVVLLLNLTDCSEVSLHYALGLIFGLLLVTIGLHDRFVKKAVSSHSSAPSPLAQLFRRMEVAPAAPVRNNTLRRLLRSLIDNSRPRRGRRSRSSRR